MFAVSNYYKYELVDAESSLEAALLFTGKSSLKLLSSEDLNRESTVIAAMCVPYTGEIKSLLELMTLDLDRVLLMEAYKLTEFYSIKL